MVQLYGQIKNPDGTTTWKPIEATSNGEGSYAIRVDTELILDGASVSISNIKVGSLNQTSSELRFLKVEDDGTVYVLNPTLEAALENGTYKLQLTDTHGHVADITEAGRILVSQEPPLPESATLVKEGIKELIVAGVNTVVTFDYTIPVGEVLHLQKFTAGAYITDEGVFENHIKFRLSYQPNASAVGEEVLDIIYFQGQSDGFRDLTFVSAAGDGTARIHLEITNWSKQPGEMTSLFRGYY